MADALQQVREVGATLTPVQATVVAAQTDAVEANELANSAQIAEWPRMGATLTPRCRVPQLPPRKQQVENVGSTLTPQQATD